MAGNEENTAGSMLGHKEIKIKENQCARRNFKLKEEEEEEEKEEEEEEKEEIRKHGCTFIIYMVKKIGKKLEKEHF